MIMLELFSTFLLSSHELLVSCSYGLSAQIRSLGLLRLGKGGASLRYKRSTKSSAIDVESSVSRHPLSGRHTEEVYGTRR
jgi:hypothetical protein